MSDEINLPATAIEHHLSRPTFSTDEDGIVQVKADEPDTLIKLFNVETLEAASGLMTCALNALGRNGENYRDMAVAMQPELKPRDAIEAMLITQLTTTHVAMTSLSQKMVDTSGGYQVREAL